MFARPTNIYNKNNKFLPDKNKTIYIESSCASSSTKSSFQTFQNPKPKRTCNNEITNYYKKKKRKIVGLTEKDKIDDKNKTISNVGSSPSNSQGSFQTLRDPLRKSKWNNKITNYYKAKKRKSSDLCEKSKIDLNTIEKQRKLGKNHSVIAHSKNTFETQRKLGRNHSAIAHSKNFSTNTLNRAKSYSKVDLEEDLEEFSTFFKQLTGKVNSSFDKNTSRSSAEPSNPAVKYQELQEISANKRNIASINNLKSIHHSVDLQDLKIDLDNSEEIAISSPDSTKSLLKYINNLTQSRAANNSENYPVHPEEKLSLSFKKELLKDEEDKSTELINQSYMSLTEFFNELTSSPLNNNNNTDDKSVVCSEEKYKIEPFDIKNESEVKIEKIFAEDSEDNDSIMYFLNQFMPCSIDSKINNVTENKEGSQINPEKESNLYKRNASNKPAAQRKIMKLRDNKQKSDSTLSKINFNQSCTLSGNSSGTFNLQKEISSKRETTAANNLKSNQRSENNELLNLITQISPFPIDKTILDLSKLQDLNNGDENHLEEKTIYTPRSTESLIKFINNFTSTPHKAVNSIENFSEHSDNTIELNQFDKSFTEYLNIVMSSPQIDNNEDDKSVVSSLEEKFKIEPIIEDVTIEFKNDYNKETTAVKLEEIFVENSGDNDSCIHFSNRFLPFSIDSEINNFKESREGADEKPEVFNEVLYANVSKSSDPIILKTQERNTNQKIDDTLNKINSNQSCILSCSSGTINLENEIKKTVDLFKREAELSTSFNIVNILKDDINQAKSNIANDFEKDFSDTLNDQNTCNTTLCNIKSISYSDDHFSTNLSEENINGKVKKFRFFDRNNKENIIAELFNENNLRNSIKSFKKSHFVKESQNILKEFSQNDRKKTKTKNYKHCIKRFKKGKTKIYKIKRQKIKRSKKQQESIEENEDFNTYFEKLTEEEEFNNLEAHDKSSSYLSQQSSTISRRSSARTYLTEQSEAFSTGSLENFTGPQKRLREGVNKACKNRALLYNKAEKEVLPEPTKRDVKMKIQEILMNVHQNFLYDKKQVIEVRKQTYNNCVFKENILQMKPICEAQLSKISYKNVSSQFKFALIIYVLQKIRLLLEEDTKLTKRELYYQMKHLVPAQNTLDSCINTISTLLDVGPWMLNLTAQKGLVYGDLKLIFNSGECLNCNMPGILIPQDINSIIEIHSNAYFILVVEKESIFHKMLEEDLPNRLTRPFIMITGKGFPDLNSQMFLRKLWMLMSIPVFILVDADPHGISIMFTYRFGSLKNSHLSKYLAVPNARWLGVFPSEISKLDVKKQSLTKRERNMVKNLLQTPYMEGNNKFKSELNIMLEKNYKAGIEDLMFNSTFLSDVYLPTKFYNQNYI